MAGKLSVTLTKSVIGEKPKTRATVRALGLRRLHQTVTHDDTPDVRGMVDKVRHLVRVEHPVPGTPRPDREASAGPGEEEVR